MSEISAVIITNNEEKNISRCINSLEEVADEVLVIDSESTDQTVQIAESLGATVHVYPWHGYSENKNYGNARAAHDYVLSIDADEALSEELADAVKHAKGDLHGAYRMSRLTNYCGSWIRHGGWYPDYKVRLFDRRTSTWKGEFVHERLALEESSEVRTLEGDLLHYSFDSLADHLARVNRYSELAAEQLVMEGEGGHFMKLLYAPCGKFWKTWLLKAGILDGFPGLCIASISAIDVFMRHLKAIQLKRSSAAL